MAIPTSKMIRCPIDAKKCVLRQVPGDDLWVCQLHARRFGKDDLRWILELSAVVDRAEQTAYEEKKKGRQKEPVTQSPWQKRRLEDYQSE